MLSPLPQVDISFDKQSEPYYPGDTVKGTVVLTNKTPLDARCVTIKCRGKSETYLINWTDLYCKKDLFRKSEMVWVSKDGQNKMPEGGYIWTFEIKLPIDCPPTHEGYAGGTNYKVKVEIDRPWKCNIREEKEIMVTRKLDIEKKWDQDGYTFTSNLRSGIFSSNGPISLKVSVPTLVFRQGQTAEFHFEVKNHSSSTINEIFIKFGKQVHYHSRNQLTPCRKFDSHSCPLSVYHQTNSSNCIGEATALKVNVAPYSTKSIILPFTIPEEAKTPSFSTGLVNFGYFMEFGIVTKLIVQPRMRATIYVGEMPVDNVTGKDDEKLKKIKQILESSGAPPAYSE